MRAGDFVDSATLLQKIVKEIKEIMIANKVERFLQFVYHIVERPGMYGVNEIDDLYFIILGYQYSDLESTSDISELLDGFREFSNKHYKTNDNHDWPKLIKLYSGSDRHSIELFGRLLEEYLRDINIPLAFKSSDSERIIANNKEQYLKKLVSITLSDIKLDAWRPKSGTLDITRRRYKE